MSNRVGYKMIHGEKCATALAWKEFKQARIPSWFHGQVLVFCKSFVSKLVLVYAGQWDELVPGFVWMMCFAIIFPTPQCYLRYAYEL